VGILSLQVVYKTPPYEKIIEALSQKYMEEQNVSPGMTCFDHISLIDVIPRLDRGIQF
jgi:hypothetical protein